MMLQYYKINVKKNIATLESKLANHLFLISGKIEKTVERLF